MLPKQMPNSLIKERRDSLNRSTFPSEMWFLKLLKTNNMFSCRRNVCIDRRFFGDFVWQRQKIVVEIDGRSHDGKEAYDDMRDKHLISLGFQVLRIKHFDKATALQVIEQLKRLLPKSRVAKKRARLIPAENKGVRVKKKMSPDNLRMLESILVRRETFRKQLLIKKRLIMGFNK